MEYGLTECLPIYSGGLGLLSGDHLKASSDADLPLIGVDPVQQGRGQGGALLRHALERCDREGMPAYLESSNPRNVPLYERHGFESIGRIQAGSSPTVIPMLRRARP